MKQKQYNKKKDNWFDTIATLTGMKLLQQMVSPKTISPIPEDMMNATTPPPQQPYKDVDPLVPAEVKPKEAKAYEKKMNNMGGSDVELDPEVQDFIENVIFPVTDKYKVPRAVAAGQFAAEGRLKGLGAERNNFYNIAAFDSNPDAAFRYETPQEGIEEYAKFVTGQSKRYASPDVQKKFSRTQGVDNPDDILAIIEMAGYAGDPKTYKDRAANGYSSYYDFIKDTPEWKKYQNSLKK